MVENDVVQVWLLMRATGSYDDYRDEPILACFDEASAKALANQATAEWNKAEDQHPRPDYPCDTASDYIWDHWREAAKRNHKRFRAVLTVDPEAGPDPDSEWNYGDSPTYSVRAVPTPKEQPHVQSER